jgi:N-acetylmuramoyl-L-alanine amidase
MPSRPGWLLGLAVALAAAAALTWSALSALRASPAPVVAADAPPDPPRWPDERASLVPLAASFPAGLGAIRVAIDPGHGAPGNRGNTSSFCVDEQDAMLDLAQELAWRLEATGHVEARLTRDPGRLVPYADRLDEAANWGADAFVSLHSDVRGRAARWSPAPGEDCLFALDAPGFAVLYSDEGDAGQAAARLALGRAVARRMAEAGFLPYDGAEYTGIYAPDARERGVFADRHAPEQRIFVLRRAVMPSILVETHNALDPREAARWGEPETLDAFASAVAAALAEALAGGPPPRGT